MQCGEHSQKRELRGKMGKDENIFRPNAAIIKHNVFKIFMLQRICVEMGKYPQCTDICPAMYYEKQRHLLKNIQDTRSIVYRTMTPQPPSKYASWDLTQFSQSPSAAPLYFPESQQWPEISSFQRWFQFWEKPEVTGCQMWAVGGLSHLGDLMFHQKLHET